MIHYIRTENNKTIVDTETINNDIHIGIIIGSFAKMLLETEESKRNEFIKDFDNLQDIREEWNGRQRIREEYKNADEFVTLRFQNISKKWNLRYITD